MLAGMTKYEGKYNKFSAIMIKSVLLLPFGGFLVGVADADRQLSTAPGVKKSSCGELSVVWIS